MKFYRDDKRKVKATVEMTPLIDVVFQLLIFFMVTSTFVTQTSIPVEMSTVEDEVTKAEPTTMTIILSAELGGPDGNGRIEMIEEGEERQRTEIFEWQQLTEKLTAFKAKAKSPAVLIKPDRSVPTELLIRVLAKANVAGIEHYNIAAEQADEE